MGNQKSSSAKKQEPKLEHSKLCEQKCKQYVDKATAEGARNTQMAKSPPRAKAPAQPRSLLPDPLQPTLLLQPVFAYQPASNLQPTYTQVTTQGFQILTFYFFTRYNLERQPASYSYVKKEHLRRRRNRSVAPKSQPNLASSNNSNPAQGSVSVKHSRQAESTPPSAPSTSNRDGSTTESRNNSNTIDSELKCRTCDKLYSLEIYQCNIGHSSCNTCKGSNRQCGICGYQITTMRNFALEDYISKKKVPCPHKDDGCKLLVKMINMDIHAKECPFKEMQCPLGCGWKGLMGQLSVHFDALHLQQRTAKMDSEIRLPDISNSSENIYLVVIDNFNFLLHVKVSEPNGKIYMTVQLIGSKFSALQWSYEVHVYNKNEEDKKFMFADTCNSYDEPVTDIFEQNKCLVLPVQYASNFVHNGALTYKIFIKKFIDDKPKGDFVKTQRGKRRK